jgi:hypothetical protein
MATRRGGRRSLAVIVPRAVFEAEYRHALARRRRPRGCWSIALLEGPSLGTLAPSPRARLPLIDPADVRDVRAGFVADPFLIHRDGRQHVFFEIYDRVRNRGLIGLAVSPDGAHRWHYEGVVLSEPHHLSYPLVFEWQGETYMTPESYQTASVPLYVADPFPGRWRRVATLVAGHPFVDPTPFHHGGTHYLFVGESHRGVLHLYRAADLFGPWEPHAMSPVVEADARHSRPAGRCLEDGEGLIRLSQSTEPVYGGYVSAARITALDPTRYREQHLEPYPLLRPSGWGWNAHGMHHLDAARRPDGSWLAVADGLALRSRWPGRMARLRSALSQAVGRRSEA